VLAIQESSRYILAKESCFFEAVVRTATTPQNGMTSNESIQRML